MSMTSTPLPPRPEMPLSLVARQSATLDVIRMMERTLRSPNPADTLAEVMGRITTAIADSRRPLTVDERNDADAYHRQVDAYNEAVRAHNEAIIARQNARENARETAKIRAARCEGCFTVPSASGACNC